ncbi:MAG TPA: YciI family protein [Actinomycetota bacterium]
MPRYLLLIYGNEQEWTSRDPEDQAAEFKLYGEYTDWLRERGWYQAGDALMPTATATSVRVRDGKTLSTDGPFAETKEQLGGYYVIQCENLDEAIDAGSRIPAARGGTIEVRPILET